jgi:hypothetical protein
MPLPDHHPASVSIATLLFKPDAYKQTIPIEHVAVRIPNAIRCRLRPGPRRIGPEPSGDLPHHRTNDHEQIEHRPLRPSGGRQGNTKQFLIEKFELVHLSTGDLLRAEIKAETELGLAAKELMDNGDLVADNIVIGDDPQQDRSTLGRRASSSMASHAPRHKPRPWTKC